MIGGSLTAEVVLSSRAPANQVGAASKNDQI